MNFELTTSSFQSTSQWHAWRLGLDLAKYVDSTPPGIPEEQAAGFRARHQALYQYFQDLLADLYENPQAYGLPEQPYEAFIESRLRMQEDQEEKKRVMAARLKARKALETGILDFLYQIGLAGIPDGQDLRLERIFYTQLVAQKAKKGGIKGFGNGFERLGLTFTGSDPVIVSNPQYPGMLPGLVTFSKACADNKDYGWYFFRRCDLGILGGKRLPDLEDGLHLAPTGLCDEIRKTDRLLTDRKYKREILVGDANAGFRLRYSKKSNQVVYWVRFMSWSSPDFDHNLRWDHKSDLMKRLFVKLDEGRPDLADRIFEGIKKCEYDYENCMARVVLERYGQSLDCCSEAGWDTIGKTPGEMEDLRFVLGVLNELL